MTAKITSGERQIVFALLLVGAVEIKASGVGGFENTCGMAGKGLAQMCGYKRWDTPKRRMMKSLKDRGWIKITVAYKIQWYQLTLGAVQLLAETSYQAQGNHTISTKVLLSAFDRGEE